MFCSPRFNCHVSTRGPCSLWSPACRRTSSTSHCNPAKLVAGPGRHAAVAPSSNPASTSIQSTASSSIQDQTRRDFLLNSSAGLSSLLLVLNLGTCRSAGAEGISIVSESEGFGKHAATDGDILLFHYVGTLEATGQVFDSTRGGLAYRDGGIGALRPAVVKLGSGPVPGLCRGLRMGLEGMRVGGRRTLLVPAELGFGVSMVGAPYSIVPPGSVLRYDVELLRLSSRGPDELTQGLSRCGTGGASESTQGCPDIELAEFI